MLQEEDMRLIVNHHKEEVVLDRVVERLEVVQRLLNPEESSQNIEFMAGVAINEVVYATKLLRALREKKHGVKTITVI